MPCRDTQDGWVVVESSDRMWSSGEGNGKPLQYFCLENPMNSVKRQKDRTLKDELPRLVGAQYATGDQWRNNFRENEEMESHPQQWKQWETLFFWLQNHCSHEIKRHLLLGRKAMTNLDNTLKSRHYFADKGPSSLSCGFSSSHVWTW